MAGNRRHQPRVSVIPEFDKGSLRDVEERAGGIHPYDLDFQLEYPQLTADEARPSLERALERVTEGRVVEPLNWFYHPSECYAYMLLGLRNKPYGYDEWRAQR